MHLYIYNKKPWEFNVVCKLKAMKKDVWRRLHYLEIDDHELEILHHISRYGPIWIKICMCTCITYRYGIHSNPLPVQKSAANFWRDSSTSVTSSICSSCGTSASRLRTNSPAFCLSCSSILLPSLLYCFLICSLILGGLFEWSPLAELSWSCGPFSWTSSLSWRKTSVFWWFVSSSSFISWQLDDTLPEREKPTNHKTYEVEHYYKERTKNRLIEIVTITRSLNIVLQQLFTCIWDSPINGVFFCFWDCTDKVQ